MATKIVEDVWDGSREDDKRIQSRDVRDHQGKGMIEIYLASSVADGDIQQGRFGTLDVGADSFGIREVQMGPQRGVGDEDFPPATTYVGQRD